METMLYAPPKNTFLTHDRLLAEKDVDNGDILLPGVVELTHLRAKPNSLLASRLIGL